MYFTFFRPPTIAITVSNVNGKRSTRCSSSMEAKFDDWWDKTDPKQILNGMALLLGKILENRPN